MNVDRDAMWADLLQFDASSADRVWDGDLRDPDAPGWYAELGSLIHQARGPAEPEELLDEPEIVPAMRRASLGAAIVALPGRPSVRRLGRVVAMKTAAAATTAGMVGVAAAATTGIVATVAATVVVPAINEKVRPVIEAHVVPVTPTDAPTSGTRPDAERVGTPCAPRPELCADPSAPVVVEVAPEAPAESAAEPAVPTEPVGVGVDTGAAPHPEPVEAAPVEPTPTEPAATEPVEAEPAPTEEPPVEEAPVETPPAEQPAPLIDVSVPEPPAETPPADTPPAASPPADPAPAEPAADGAATVDAQAAAPADGGSDDPPDESSADPGDPGDPSDPGGSGGDPADAVAPSAPGAAELGGDDGLADHPRDDAGDAGTPATAAAVVVP